MGRANTIKLNMTNLFVVMTQYIDGERRKEKLLQGTEVKQVGRDIERRAGDCEK
jgi:hypothetical protein